MLVNSSWDLVECPTVHIRPIISLTSEITVFIFFGSYTTTLLMPTKNYMDDRKFLNTKLFKYIP
jgi:hypothetical protein